MWFIGLIVGTILGAGMHGFYGAMWGAILGWLAGLLLGRSASSAQQVIKEDKLDRLDKRLAHAQKAVEDIHWRLNRLEESAGLTPAVTEAVPPPESPIVQPMPAQPMVTEPVAPAPPAATPQPILEQETRERPSVVAPVQASMAAASARRVEAVPKQPGMIERLLEGNIVAKLGVVILFFGVGFLLKLAYDKGMFPPSMRLLGVAVASVAMFFTAFRLLQKQRTYALILLGGAMGLLYLDVYFALKTFALINAPFGFLLFAALGVSTIALAVKFDARAFAALGLLGAFMAPILASTGSGNHVLLFSYYLLLNLVILGASWFKAWRELNFIGFLFTFAIALIWGYGTYQPEHFSTVEPFLIAFFLLYLAIPILFAQRQPPELKGLVDATLVFGMPLSAAMLQAALTRGMGDYVLAWSAFGAALIYLTLAWLLWKRERMRLLAEAHLALGVVFGTAAPYFAFQGYPTFAFWTLEGAAIFWMGCRQKSVLARAFALCLQFGAAAYFWWVTQGLSYADPWWNDRVVGCGLIAVATLTTAGFMRRFEQSISASEESIQGLVIAWGCAWLFAGFAFGTWQQWTLDETRISALLIFAAVVFTLFEWLGAWTNWRLIRLASRAHVLLIGILAVAWADMTSNAHPLSSAGVFAWPLSFIVYFYVLHRQRGDEVEAASGWRYWSAWLLMLALATWEVLWRYAQQQFGWVIAIGVAGLVAASLRFRLREYSVSGDAKPVQLSNIPLLWALFWWFAGLHGAIELRAEPVHHVALHLTAAGLSILAFDVAGRTLAWSALRRTQVLLTLAMLIAAMHLADHHIHPFMGAQFLSWLLAFVVGGIVLAMQERDGKAWAAAGQHAVLFNLALLLVAWEACWRADDAGLSDAWQYAGVGLTLAGGLALATFAIRRNLWPFGPHAAAVRDWSVKPMLLVAMLWTIFANVDSSGAVEPLTYLPILNPLDLAQLGLFAASIWSLRHLQENETANITTLPALLTIAAAGFFWVNAALMRTVHHWAGVPFELSALLHSVVAQAALSLLWTATALVIMWTAGKRSPPSRGWWMAGAALLGVVVLKLFVSDLGNTGTVARIVSFIGVGVLLLVIGYVAPVPPKDRLENNQYKQNN